MKLAEILALNEAVVKAWRKRTLLNKSEHFNEKDIVSATDALLKHCPGFLSALKNGGIIYRGSSKSSRDLSSPRAPKLSYIDSSTGIRTSKDTDNVYQLMMAISRPLNKAGIPDRSKSLICSTSLTSASSYGAVSVVVPVGKNSSSLITFCDKRDFLNRDVNFFGREVPLDYLSDKLFVFMNRVGTHTLPLANRYESVVSLHQFQETIAKAPIDDVIDAFVRTFPNASVTYIREFVTRNHSNLTQAIADEVFTPDSLNLSVANYGDKLPESKECWFSGKAFLVPIELFKAVVIEIKSREE
jgi:hypothetical protein